VARTDLIVNADDFGLSPGVNAGVATAHQEGILTSASLMVRWPAAGDAALYGRATPSLAVGLHVDLGEWTYLEGTWRPLYVVVDVTDADAVTSELDRQLEAFRDLLGRDPTHIDSHQHVHREDPVRRVVMALGRRLRCPVRQVSPGIRYVGDFYGQSADGAPFCDAVSVDGLLGLIRRLPEGIVELACHPAAAADMDGMYRHERTIELATLCHPALRDVLAAHSVELRSFAELVEGAAGSFTIRRGVGGAAKSARGGPSVPSG
jgi:predicted glycoside hydrolase/deacetylase ChbG (UPF0249 family)